MRWERGKPFLNGVPRCALCPGAQHLQDAGPVPDRHTHRGAEPRRDLIVHVMNIEGLSVIEIGAVGHHIPPEAPLPERMMRKDGLQVVLGLVEITSFGREERLPPGWLLRAWRLPIALLVQVPPTGPAS